MQLEPGTELGKYVLGRKLGQGGFGVVFKAHDANLDRDVALKFLHPEHTATPQMLQRFLQEARSAAKIAHPGIVTVFECGQMTEAGGAAYIAMEVLVGESLTDRLARSGRLAPGAAMEVVRQVASALDAAHRMGIVHRDLKPDNIFLVQDPAVRGGERIKVLDFGIAKLGRQASSSMQTQSMMVFGTPRYMSPEQCKSAANVDARSDIYTLGCILFELVTGKPPFAGEPGELIAQHLLVPPPTVLSVMPDAPVALDKLVTAMMAKTPDARPSSMAMVQLALESGADPTNAVAPTMGVDGMSLPPYSNSGAIGVRPAVSTFRGSTHPTAMPGVSNPTTLGAAAGSSVSLRTAAAVRGGGRRAWMFAALGLVVAGGIGAIVIATHNSGEVAAAKVSDVTPTPVEKPAPEPAKTVDKPAVAPVVVETGTIALTSRPVCDILVDGTPVGHHTPERALVVPVGHHDITLVDSEHKIHDTFAVDVKAGANPAIDKDYLPKAAPVVVAPPPRVVPVVKAPPPKVVAEPPPVVEQAPPPVVEKKQPPSKNGTINPFAKKP